MTLINDLFYYFSAIASTPQTATDTTDYATVSGSVAFSQGDCAVARKIELKPDILVEGFEYFEVAISTVAGTNAARGTIHSDLSTAKVFIIDHTSK